MRIKDLSFSSRLVLAQPATIEYFEDRAQMRRQLEVETDPARIAQLRARLSGWTGRW